MMIYLFFFTAAVIFLVFGVSEDHVAQISIPTAYE